MTTKCLHDLGKTLGGGGEAKWETTENIKLAFPFKTHVFISIGVHGDLPIAICEVNANHVVVRESKLLDVSELLKFKLRDIQEFVHMALV